ncbi:MAG: hypothetical protein WA749_15950 [Gelidibacter sp.]
MKIFGKITFNSVFVTNFGLVLIMSLLLVGDTLTRVYLKENLKFSFLFKAIITLVLLVILVYSNKALLIGIVLLCLSVSVGMIFNNLNDFIPKTSLVFEYLSGLLFFNYLIINNKKRALSKIFMVVFIFYCSTILIAFLFQVGYLRTYYGQRFGYMPFFSSQNEFSFIMIAIIIFFYKKYLKFPSEVNLVLVLMAITSSLLIGTKVSYIFSFSFIVYIFLKRYNFKILIFLTTLLFLLIFLLKDYIYKFLYISNKVLLDVYSEKGFINFMSSLRYEFFKDRMDCQFLKMDFYNYLFGGIQISCITEMSLTDILLTFGLFGSLFYFYLLRKFILKKLDLDIFGYYVITLIAILSFLGGYYFENLSAQFYVIGVLYIYYYPSKDLSQKT